MKEETSTTAATTSPMHTSPGLVIRSYEPDDFEQVWALHREGVMETTPSYPVFLAHYEDDLRDIEATYLAEGSHFWVVEGPDGLVAMTAVQRIDAETARLRRMRVTAAWRRNGVARALLRRAEAFCRAHGYRRLILDTTEDQVAGQKLYESSGFRRTGERSLGPFRVFDYEKELA